MISVILPTIGRPTLQRAIDSVHAQDTKEEVELLTELGAPPFSIPNLCKSRNKMASKAKGEWLAFLDDDDYWLPNHLSVLSDDYNVSISSCQHLLNGTPESMLTVLERGASYAGSGICIRKDLFDSVGGFDEDVEHSDFWTLLIKVLPNKLLINKTSTWYRDMSPGFHLGQVRSNKQVVAERLQWLSEFRNKSNLT
jgi:glycosyltransferase involved in cell wall biosynthesis